MFDQFRQTKKGYNYFKTLNPSTFLFTIYASSQMCTGSNIPKVFNADIALDTVGLDALPGHYLPLGFLLSFLLLER